MEPLPFVTHRRRCQPCVMQEGSRKAIIAAFFANLGIAVAKFVGFLITRSAGLLAESVTRWPTPATRRC